MEPELQAEMDVCTAHKFVFLMPTTFLLFFPLSHMSLYHYLIFAFLSDKQCFYGPSLPVDLAQLQEKFTSSTGSIFHSCVYSSENHISYGYVYKTIY